jgi:hypothetical protein
MFFVQQPIINPNKENLTFFEGIMLGLQEALAYERGELKLETKTLSTEGEENDSLDDSTN